jgi:hypothetical protein
LEVTRVAAVTNCAVTHGPFAPGGGGSAQPATSHGAGIVTLGWPLTVTRGFGTVACACPPCEQSTLTPTWMRKPGIVHLLGVWAVEIKGARQSDFESGFSIV